MAFEIDKLVELAAEAGQSRIIEKGGDYLVMVRPNNLAYETIDLEEFGAHPRRAKGDVTLRDPASFIAYVLDYKDPDVTQLFADQKKVTAVLNHHRRIGLDAGWSDWRAVLELKYTPAWTAWATLATSGWMAQADFADFIEVNYQDILKPAPADFLEIVTNLRLASASVVESKLNAANGALRVRYEENFVPVGGKGDDAGVVEIPTVITLSLQVFEGGKAFDIDALLRYRVNQGAISFRLQYRNDLQRKFDEAFEEMLAGIAEAVGLPVLRGVVG